MTAAIAAYRAGNAPHILQVFEVGTATMMGSKGAIVPVGEVMAKAGYKFDPKIYVPAVAGYYTAPNGQMMSYPLNSSTTVFYYNKDAFKKAGLDPNKPPKTWPEVALAAAKLKASGEKCPFTTSWQSWTQLESFSTWHNTRVRDQEQRLRRTDSAAGVRHAAAYPPYREPGEHVQAGTVRLQGPRQCGRRAVLLRRMRDEHRVIVGLRQHQEERQVRLRHARRCRITPTSQARRRTPSSAAPACG